MTSGVLRSCAIVVVNYGSHDLLRAGLGPLARELPEVRIVVVDNYSTSAERTAVEVLCHDLGWCLVPLDDNRGFGAGVNAGIAFAQSLGDAAVLVLNPDAEIEAQDARGLLEQVLEDDRVVVAPLVLDSQGQVWSEGTYLYLDRGDMGSVGNHGSRSSRPHLFWVSGACFAVNVELWELVGGFREEYFMYWEDVDLCYRVTQCGAEVRVDVTRSAVHGEGGTQQDAGQRRKSQLYYYYNTRNRLVFAALHLDRPAVRRWRLRSFQAARAVLLRGGRRQFLRPVAPVKSGALGTLAGLRFRPGP